MSFRLTKKRTKLIVSLLVTILIILLSRIPINKTPVPLQAGFYRVAKFEDGDTIVVNMNGTEEKVRFIGVDTPETKDPRKPVQCYGPQASQYTHEIIGDQPVRLEADPTNTNRDRYGRLLRYVYLPDGRLLNQQLIEQGYGFAYISFPFEKKSEFVAAQESAKSQGKGLWTACHPEVNQYGGYTSNALGS